MKIFWTILIVLLTFGFALAAGPYLTTIPVTESVTSYKLILDTTEYTEMPFTSQSGTVQMVKDLEPLNLSNGKHTGTIQAFNTLWGVQTDPVPFEFTKPAQLTNPSIELVSTDPRS